MKLFTAAAIITISSNVLSSPASVLARNTSMSTASKSSKGRSTASMSTATKSSKVGKASKHANDKKVQESIDKLGFDIFGDASIFQPSSSIEVDDSNCEYTATVRLQFRDADVPFPLGPQSCDLAVSHCNGQSCLYEVRNVYSFSQEFEEVTGFNHVGIDWSPCGHPPLDKFGRPHWNLHVFRVTPEERLNVRCVDGMLNPFICAVPSDYQGLFSEQPTPEGKAFYVWGKDTSGAVANVPDTFEAALDTAVPGEGVHTWNQGAAKPVAEWDEPLLIMGLYDGGIQFWEPMFPHEFVSGDTENEYEEEGIEYVTQTIQELPFEYSMKYDPSDGFTTLIMKGHVKGCEVENI